MSPEPTLTASNASCESTHEHCGTARIRNRRMRFDARSRIHVPAVPLPWLLLLLLLTLISCARAAIHTYSGQRAYYSADLLLYRAGREGMFATSPGSGYIRLNGLHLQRPSWEAELQPLEGVTGMVEVVVFDMRVRHMIGYRWRNSSSTDTTPFAHTDSGVEGNEEGSGPLFFCCTKELEPLTGCTVGRLIVRRAAHEPDWPQVLEAQFIGNSSLTATLDAEVHVPRAGFVYVWLAMCDKNLDNTKVFGHTEWRAHGWGYLPGMLSAHLPIQTSMLVLYTFLYLAWRPQFGPAWHSLDRNSLPHFLTFLLLLSLLSTLTTLCDLLLLCTTGHRFVLVTLAAVTVGVLQGLLLRGVLVGVAVGVGTLLPKVGVIPGKALIPAALYVLVAATCEAVRTVGQVDDWGSGEHVALCSPLVLLDLCLAAWLIPAALTTKAQASDSRLLSTFRQALSAMGGISAAALALTCWEAYVKLSDPLNLQWQSDWLITAAWHLLSFLALASLCFLWSPALLSLRHDGSTQGDKGEAASLLS